MQRITGNNSIAGGHQITFRPSKNIAINSSSFVGNMESGNNKLMRYFHNFYGQFQISDKLGFILGFDIGLQQRRGELDVYENWYSPVFIARYTPAGKVDLALRLEYYSDEDGVIIQTYTPRGFQTLGYSLNMDYNISKNVLWRIEGRAFSSKDQIFDDRGNLSNTNTAITTSLALAF